MNTELILKKNNKNQKTKKKKKKPQKTTYMYIGLEVSDVAAFLFGFFFFLVWLFFSPLVLFL